jgi:transposase
MANSTHEVFAGTRLSWSCEEKLAILAEARAAPTSVSAVARRHGLHPSLLFRGRREVEDAVGPRKPTFVPLALPGPVTAPLPGGSAAGVIEIELAGGDRVRAEGAVDSAVLRGVVEALAQR